MRIVFGGSGYIGKSLCAHFSEKGNLLVGTYHERKQEGLVQFDLERPDLGNLGINLDAVDYAIISSGIAKLNACQRDPEKARRVNVDGTKQLIMQCFRRGIVPIFVSADRVFDGKMGDYREEDQTNPSTMYGISKKSVEDFLLESNERYVIARIGKVFGLTPGDDTLLTKWAEQLRANDIIRCTTDQKFTLLYQGDLVRAFDRIMEKDLSGVYHISSPEKFNRHELATLVKETLGIKSGKIIPCSRKDFDFADSESSDISLNSEKFRRKTDFKFTTMEECLLRL